MKQDPDTSMQELPTNLEEAAKKRDVPNNLHFHFDMGADASSGMIEAEAHKHCKKYFGDVEYRLNIVVNAIMLDGRINGYKVQGDARKWIDYGEW